MDRMYRWTCCALARTAEPSSRPQLRFASWFTLRTALIVLQRRLGDDVEWPTACLRKTLGPQVSLSDRLANHVWRHAKSVCNLLNGKNSIHGSHATIKDSCHQ